MGILTGSLTALRFTIEGSADLGEGWREIYREALDRYHFRPVPRLEQESAGWVAWNDVNVSSFEAPTVWEHDGLLLVTWRTDKKKLPKKAFDVELAKRVAAWCTESEVQRCPSSVRTQFKDDLREEWLARMVPDIRTRVVVWNLKTGIVLIEGSSVNQVEEARKFFFKTFARRLIYRSTLLDLDRHLVRKITGIVVDPTSVDVPKCPPGVGSRFGKWLLHCEQEDAWPKVEVEGDALDSAWLEDKVSFSSEDQTIRGTLKGESPASSRDIHSALGLGRQLTQVVLAMHTRDGFDYEFTVDLGSLEVSHVVLPSVVADTPESAVTDRIYLYDRAWTMYTAIVEAWMKSEGQNEDEESEVEESEGSEGSEESEESEGSEEIGEDVLVEVLE